MESVNMHEAKTHFSKLVARVQQGESVLIAKAGRAVARIVPVEPEQKSRLPRLGFLQGQGHVPLDWKELGREELEEDFYGKE